MRVWFARATLGHYSVVSASTLRITPQPLHDECAVEIGEEGAELWPLVGIEKEPVARGEQVAGIEAVSPCGLEDLALDFLASVARLDELGEIIECSLGGCVELRSGAVGREAVVVGVVDALGPRACAIDTHERVRDGFFGGVRGDVVLTARHLLTESGVVSHPQHGGEGVGKAEP